MATEHSVRACRIADAAVLLVLPDDDADDPADITLNDQEPSRLFTARAGQHRIAIAAFGSGGAEGGALALPAVDAGSEIVPEEEAAAVVAALRLDFEQAARLLFVLAGKVTKLFRLQHDPILARFLRDSCQRLPVPHARLQIHTIDGYPDAIIRFSREASLSPGTMVVGFGNAADEIRRFDLILNGDTEVGHFRLAHVQLPCPAEELTGFLILSEEQAIWFDVTVDASASPAAFHQKCGHAAPEVLALLLQHAEPELQQDLIAVDGAESKSQQIAALPSEGFYFSVDALHALDTGVFLAGWLLDPQQEFRAAQVIDYSLRDSAIETRWTSYDGFADVNGVVTAVRGFCAWMERGPSGAIAQSPAVRVSLNTGRSFICRGGPVRGDVRAQRDSILSALHAAALDAGALERAYQPALAAVARRLVPSAPVRKVEDFGRRSSRESSVIIPLYGNLRFLRSQLLGFAGDPRLRETCELIFVLDDPKLCGETLQRLDSLAQVTGLDIRLVQMSVNCGYGPATNAGAAVAEGRKLVLMNSDIVPIGGGWLQQMTDCLDGLPAHSIVGPKLLYADGSLQHAGMYFYRLRNGVFQNMHYYKGYGRRFAPAGTAREVPAVTGAVMMLSRESFRAVGGFTTDYIIGDYEDSDLCLKMRAQGGRCFYLPDAEFYHFERQSMASHPSAQENGSTAYNRHLHHRRWERDIAALMEQKDFRHGANAY